MMTSLAANPAVLFWACLLGLALTLLVSEYLRPYIVGGSNDPVQHSSLRLFQASAVVSGLLLAGMLLGANGMLRQRAARPAEEPPSQSEAAPQGAAPTATPAAEAASAETPQPQVVLEATATPSEPSPTPRPRALVVNTGGAGVNVRARPSTNAQIVGLAAEGSLVDLLGERAQDEVFTWERILTAEGVEGWVVDRFLEPQP